MTKTFEQFIPTPPLASLTGLLRRNGVRRLAVLVALSVAVPLAACTYQTEVVTADQRNTLTVSGEGEASAAPDLATVRLGVEERGPSAQGAMERANERMSAIISAVKEHGVEAKDIQTTDLSVYFEQNHEEPVRVHPPEPKPAPDTPTGQERKVAEEPKPEHSPRGQYVVRNTVVVSVRAIDKLGSVIGAAMTAGANNLHGLELSIEDPSDLSATARERAVAHAKKKAEALAKSAGVRLGPVITVKEAGDSSPRPYPAFRQEVTKQASDVPVEQGQLTIQERVEVVYSLIQD